jgi:transcription antitermination factor NusG
MNDLQHIRSMAEMIIQKVDALDGTKTPEPKVAEPKFKVGDSVYFSHGKTNGVGVVHKHAVHNYRNSYLIHYPVNNVIANQWFNEEMLSHAQPKVAEPKFKVGDKVHLIDNYYGPLWPKVQTIARSEYLSHQQCYQYWFNRDEPSDSPAGGFHESSLELATEVKRVWHSGPPPHIGWWNASFDKSYRDWRWWDGSRWSKLAFPEDPACYASIYADTKVAPEHQHAVRWSDYWPENARVPRVDPGV